MPVETRYMVRGHMKDDRVSNRQQTIGPFKTKEEAVAAKERYMTKGHILLMRAEYR